MAHTWRTVHHHLHVIEEPPRFIRALLRGALRCNFISNSRATLILKQHHIEEGIVHFGVCGGCATAQGARLDSRNNKELFQQNM
jgi:hypothetical protein